MEHLNIRMLDKLKAIYNRYIEVEQLISSSEAMNDMKFYVQLSKEYKDLTPIVKAYHEYSNVISNIDSSKKILNEENDEEMREMAKMELDELLTKREEMDEEIKILLIPKDPEDSKNAVMEIRAGTGGDEASIFAGDLYKMYTAFASSKGWTTELVDIAEGTSGGYKEIIFNVKGENVYGQLKFESGVHRVQRVPQTETQGRVHTSASTVMVLPEAEEFDVDLDMQDVRIERTTSTGPGGQSVNTTYSAIKLHHEPTGIIVSCQDQKSQHKNLEKALKVLRSRLYELEMNKRKEEDSQKRNLMVSSGDRSAKIRTYNYPQGRVTDHRINLTLYDLQNIVNGDIDKLVEELKLHNNIQLMNNNN